MDLSKTIKLRANSLETLEKYSKKILARHESLCTDDEKHSQYLAEILAYRVSQDFVVGVKT